MEIIKISNQEYYLIDDLMKNYPNYFKDITHPRDVIILKNLSIDDYLFVKQNKENQWLTSIKKYTRAKLVLTKEWCLKNIEEIKPKIENIFPMAFLLKKIDF